MSTDTIDFTSAQLRDEIQPVILTQGFEAATAFVVKEALHLDTRIVIEADGAMTRLSFQSQEFSIEIKRFLDQSPHTYSVKHLRNGSSFPVPSIAYEGPSAVDALCEGLLEAHINKLFW